MATQTQPTRREPTIFVPADITPLVRRKAVESLTGDSRSTIYRKMQQGLFPKAIAGARDRIGRPTTAVWPAHEVDAVNRARIAGKSEDEIRALVAELEAARIQNAAQ